MLCFIYARIAALTLLAATVIAPVAAYGHRASKKEADQGTTVVTLRWGQRAGVVRYRLQLAADVSFTNIVFDGIVRGHEYTISDLAPGKYFWRVAPLTNGLGRFSSAGVIEVKPEPSAPRDTSTVAKAPSSAGGGTTNETIRAGGGWYAALGSVNKSASAHLRAPNSFDLIAVTDDGRVVALDASNGRALWTARPQVLRARTSGDTSSALPLAIPTRIGLDNVMLLGANAAMLDGRTGRQVWQSGLPSFVARATLSGENIFAIDSSLQKLFVLAVNDGKIISEARLPRRIVGSPASVLRSGTRVVLIALDDGRIQLIDQFGKVIVEGDAGASATTAPLAVRTPRGELILVGTSSGLTALNADDLRPLGRINLKGDRPRGTLIAQDLDGDKTAEGIMFTDSGRVMVVKSDEGRIVWEADAKQAESAAFADINNDGISDLLMAAREDFAFALSGRDGALIWRSNPTAGVATNHAPTRLARVPVVVPTSAGVLLIAGDATGGLRALEFRNRAVPPR